MPISDEEAYKQGRQIAELLQSSEGKELLKQRYGDTIIKQNKKLSLAEALVFVERNFREEAKTEYSALCTMLSISVTDLLQRKGNDVLAHGLEIELALYGILVMTLTYFDKANGLILTVTEQSARSFFENRLFTKEKGEPTAYDLALRCGKRLISSESLNEENSLIEALNDYNSIPIMDVSTFMTVMNRRVVKERSFLQKLFGPSEPPLNPLGEGLMKLNCVMKISGESISLDDNIDLFTVTNWAFKNQGL